MCKGVRDRSCLCSLAFSLHLPCMLQCVRMCAWCICFVYLLLCLLNLLYANTDRSVSFPDVWVFRSKTFAGIFMELRLCVPCQSPVILMRISASFLNVLIDLIIWFMPPALLHPCSLWSGFPPD